MRICREGSVFRAGTLYSFAFLAVNPDFEQACPAIKLDATAQDVNIVHRNMSKVDVELLGVPHASCPLTVFQPLVLHGFMNQSVAFTNSLNQFVLTVRLNVNLRGDQQSALTISGLAGAKLEDNLNLGMSADGTGTWCLPDTYFAAESESVTVSVCPGSEAVAWETYLVYFTLRNPGLSQPSPDISVGAMSAATVVQEGGIELPKVQVPAVLVEKSSAAVLGVESGTTPLFVKGLTFSIKNITQ